MRASIFTISTSCLGIKSGFNIKSLSTFLGYRDPPVYWGIPASYGFLYSLLNFLIRVAIQYNGGHITVAPRCWSM